MNSPKYRVKKSGDKWCGQKRTMLGFWLRITKYYSSETGAQQAINKKIA